MKLNKYEYVVSAFAAPANGPGWSNAPVQVVIKNNYNGKFRIEYLQPDQHTHEICTLYSISHTVHSAMLKAVNHIVKKTK